MVRKRVLFFVGLAAAGLSLIVSFGLSNRLWLAAVALVPVGSMLFAHILSKPWLAHVSLAGLIGVAALGALLNIPLMVMVFVSTAALASWDLTLESQQEYPTSPQYDRRHLQYLGAALGIGLLGVGILHRLHWHLSFVAMLILGIILLICLNSLLNYFHQLMGSHG